MIGQKKLISKIDSLQKLPHSILIVGDRGSEQDLVCNYIAEKFNLVEFDMTECISDEFIDQIYASHTFTLYTVNLFTLGEREQNIMLKLFEEPTEYAYVLLLAESDATVLDTIKSRSILFKSDTYDKELLKGFVIDKTVENMVLDVCTTPGQVDIANKTDMSSLYSLCNKIIDSMSVANYANALSIANKINFKDSYEKFDLYMFLRVLRKVILDRGNSYNIYEHLIHLNSYIFSMNDKRLAFENFITKMWLSSRIV